MKFLPTENITYKTRLNEDEIIKRLTEIIEPVKALKLRLFNSYSSKPYEGQVNGHMFEIRRIIGYRNSFLPRINGMIVKDYDGVKIKVRMRLHIVVMVLLCICGGVELGFIAFLSGILRTSKFDPVTLIPFGMLLFAYGLTMGAFKLESKKSKKDLEKIFEADVIQA
jgi:hypothetical protein